MILLLIVLKQLLIKVYKNNTEDITKVFMQLDIPLMFFLLIMSLMVWEKNHGMNMMKECH